MFRNHATIKMHQIDAAQRLFFAEQFVLAHDAWEACLESMDYGLGKVIAAGEFVFPIVHAEANYTAPVVSGDRIRVDVCCERIGSKSFTVGFFLSKEDGTLLGRGSHVHATVSAKTGMPIPVPERLIEVLGRIGEVK